ncbi:MAG: hypothetical protein JWN36_2874 [Microbacteriaceae bacterium]|nr:hypothetical protein [Microbacteriaceae bacterium]
MTRASHRFRPHHGIRTRVAFAALLALALSLGGAVLIAQPAHAAGIGVGWDFDRNSHLGAYTVPGGNAYCLNPGLPPATAATSDAGIVSSFTSAGPTAGRNVVTLGAATLARINYLVTTYGQTTDRDVASAVAMAVATTANPAAYAAHTAPWGDDFYVHYMPAADFARVKALAAQFRAEAAAVTPGVAESAAMSLSMGADNSAGALSVTALAPPSAPATITLANGVFVATGTSTFVGTATAGMSRPIRAVAPAGSAHYRVSAHADFTGGGGVAGAVHLWTTPGRQALATPGGSAPGSFAADARDAVDRSALFAPVVTTQVASPTLARGQRSIDTVTFAATSFVDPVSGAKVQNAWPSTTAGPVAVTASGILYGPAAQPVAASAAPPAGTPIAARATVSGGPGAHAATADTTATAGGYYTWVWIIQAADQDPATRALLPPDYRFADGFGVAAEGQFTPARHGFTTRLASSVVAACGTVTDRLTPADGEWLRAADGSVIPVTLTGRVYRTATQPARSTTVPADARLIGTVNQVLVAPGAVTSAPLDVGCEPGYVTVQWSVEPAAQPEQFRALVEPWSDDFGVPDETARVAAPQKQLASTGVSPNRGLVAGAFTMIATGIVLVARRRPRN